MKIEYNFQDKNGNSIEIDKSTELGSSSIEFNDKNSSLTVGKNCNISSSRFVLGTKSTLKIGDRCNFGGTIIVGAYSSVTIGNDLSVTKNMFIRAVEATAVVIGNDCLIATDVVLRTTDGHPIYDRKTRERLNKSKDINIGDHVWLADQSTVLKGVTIGKASVIGIKSLVTKDIPNNCVAVGIPARVVRKEIVWEHGPGHFSEEFY